MTTHLPHVRKPQATVLALWSFGMVLARSCALTAVSPFRAAGLRRKEQTVRQQVREWGYEATAKQGPQRPALQVEDCFAPLLGWVRSGWPGTQLAVALEATTWGTRVVVLAISVVYRGGAIPVAWGILPAGATQAWRSAWVRLRRRRWRAGPKGGTVIVLAERGWYAPWLLHRMVRLGWHPVLRSNTGGTFRPAGTACFRPLATCAPQTGTCGQGRGTAWKSQPAACTWLARWEDGSKDPWLLRTDRPPEASDACWYGVRAWIEQGCKVTKRAGWPWHRTRRTTPERAARLWLAVAVATLWGLSVGEEVDITRPASTLPDVTALCPARPRTRRATRLRVVSVFRRGWNRLLVALLRQESLPLGAFVPEPWPVRAPLLPEESGGPPVDVPLAA